MRLSLKNSMVGKLLCADGFLLVLILQLGDRMGPGLGGKLTRQLRTHCHSSQAPIVQQTLDRSGTCGLLSLWLVCVC